MIRKKLTKICIIGVLAVCFLFQVNLAGGNNGIYGQNQKSNVPMEIELYFSSVPMLNEDAVLNIEIRALKDAPNTLIDIELPNEGFKLISGSTHLIEDLSSGSTTIYQIEVLPVEIGQYEISASATSQETDYIFGKREALYVHIAEEFSEISKNSFIPEIADNRSEAIKIGNHRKSPIPVLPDHTPIEGQEVSYLAAPGPGQIVVKGSWSYQDKGGFDQPLRGARVEIWDADSLGDTQLGIAYTDISGDYVSGPILNSDHDGGGQDIFVKVFSTDNRSVRVTDFSSASDLYYSVTAVQNNVADGYVDVGSHSINDVNNRMAWYIYDIIANDAFDYLDVNVSWKNTYNLKVRWSPTNTSDGTHYHPGGSIDLLAGDRWDPDVFLHEYGHFVMYKIYGGNMPSSPNCYSHYWGSHSSLGCAWTEGWANFLQAAIQNDRFYDDTEDQILHIDFEPPTPKADHPEDEGAVAASLWDIFDPASNSETWDTIGNGINGSSKNGIWSIIYSDEPADFLEFYSNWINSSNGYNPEITAILQHHQIDPAIGSLKVTIAPSGAVSAGAQWRVDGGSWRNSGSTQSGLSVGSHTVEFKAVSGWTKPGNQSVTINSNQTTTTSGTYTRQTGTLKVTIAPSGAVSAGAQWRVDGGSWRNSGSTQSGLSVGSHTVEFKAVSGWSKPGNQSVTINSNQTTTTSGTYTQQTGTLKVTIAPSGAVSAGAQWRVDGGSWRNGGSTQSGLSVGSHTVEFKAVSGWSKPGNKTASINSNQTTTTSGTYTQQTGTLKVTIAPSGAVSAGAQWRVDGGSWRNSGSTQSGLSVGSHTVEFKAVSGWSKPGNKTASINSNQTTTTSGTYTQQTGTLKVTIAPSGAVSAGAQWRVDGGSWRNGGSTQSGLSVGTHTVEFKAVSGWAKPGNQSVTVNSNQTTSASGTYTKQTGILKVTIAPSGAVSAGAQWRANGGSWRNSGSTQSGLSVGTHTVEFKAVSGWSKPGNKTVTINYNQTTNASGTYTSLSIPPEIVEEDSYPHDAQGMDPGTLRVAIDTSIVTRIQNDDGIDEDNIEMRIGKQFVNIRVQEVNDGDDTDYWIIHSPKTPFAFEKAVNYAIDAENLLGVEMDTYYSSFKTESEGEHDTALANTPSSTEYFDDPVIGQNTIVADPATAIEGAEIIYDNGEPVTPRFGPLAEIPNLDIVKGVGVPLNMQPATVFVNPVTVFIPCPAETDLGTLEIYVFNPAIGWQASWETDGCIVPGSRVNHGPDDPDPTEPPTIEIQLNHFSAVQAGKPAAPILPSAGAGGGGGGGGGGCFITAAGGKPQKLQMNLLAFVFLLNLGFAGFAGIRRKFKK